MQEIRIKRSIWKEDYQKAFKKLTLFFSFGPSLPFNGQDYEK